MLNDLFIHSRSAIVTTQSMCFTLHLISEVGQYIPFKKTHKIIKYQFTLYK